MSLDPDFPHIMISTDGWIPDIRFYSSQDLQGKSVLHLNADGLFQGDTLLCQWPGGRFDAASSFKMVLGYSGPDLAVYKGCGDDPPILSTWGDGGTGTAVLYVRVNDKRGSIIKTTHKEKQFYFNLGEVPKGRWEWLNAGDDFHEAGD